MDSKKLSFDKILKSCEVIYLKNADLSILKGKIIISDSPEIGRLCYIHGIVHVLYTGNHIPHDKIDCIISKKDSKRDLESMIIKSELKIPILYQTTTGYMAWCPVCTNTYELTGQLNKYCSEKCMKKDIGFTSDSKIEQIKDLNVSDIVNKIINDQKVKEKEVLLEFDKTVSDKKKISDVKKTVNKFQTSVVKDAIRLEFAFKRESYVREMKQPSLRKANLSNPKKSVGEQETVKICRGMTKKGKQCTNRTIGSSMYCGILSHSMAPVGAVASVNGNKLGKEQM